MRLQKDLRRPSPLIAQESEELPFSIELRGSAKFGQHLASNAVDAHPRPLCAFDVARIGDLPKERHHAQLLQENGIEGHLVQPVENLGGRARWFLAFDRVDRNENGVLRFALSNEGRKRGIAGIAAVPVGLAVYLYGLEHGGQTGRGEQNVRGNGAVLEHVTAASPHIGGRDEELNGRLLQPLEIDEIGQNLAQWIRSHRVQLIGRKQPRHEIHGHVNWRRIQCPAAENDIERPTLERAEASSIRDAAPEFLKGLPRARGPAFDIAVGEHRGVHRARRRAGNTVDFKPWLFEQTIENAPGERPMRASALQRKIDKHGIACDGGFSRFHGHQTSRRSRDSDPVSRRLKKRIVKTRA